MRVGEPVASDLIFGFDRPHKPGTICSFPCEQCGLGRDMMLQVDGKRVEDAPLFIIAETSREKWRRQFGQLGLDDPEFCYFYFVRTD